ncbi:hypothetical protein RvY_18070 [Ramazzottius varieornatus]|uniref:Uncharacterized protein n=1 Tax=Ramazzottius varieornatus TaxID=947166 RepID=A0A1D1W4E6_RAMVA|nr:hypothetical protein RvY_18070 [Ramazzottius varieornatus]
MDRFLQISIAVLCLLAVVYADPPADVNHMNRQINQAAAAVIQNAQAQLNNSMNSAQPGSSVAVSCSSDAQGNSNCQRKTVDAAGNTNIINTSGQSQPGGAVVSSSSNNNGAQPAGVHTTTINGGTTLNCLCSILSVLSIYLVSRLL